MGVVRKRPAAKRDLIDQFEWYAENAGLKIAARFLQAANATLDRLSEMPESGALVPVEQEQLIGLRRCPVSGFD